MTLSMLTYLILAVVTPHDATLDAVEYLPVDEPARIVSGFTPGYPPSLIDVDLFPVVTVSLAVYINREGKAIKKVDMTKVKVPGEFICAAEQAAEKSVWTPAKWGDYLVGSWVIYEIRFVSPKFGPKEDTPKK